MPKRKKTFKAQSGKPKLIVICGPTSTGKSSLAVSLAKKVNGEVISADSRQVYKGLNLLSGKITKKEMRGIPHHMLDIVSPKSVFSAHDFVRYAEKIIRNIERRGKVPIIAGGTGFYIHALISPPLLPNVPPNAALRKRLSQYSTKRLFSILSKKDPERAQTIDMHNKVRIIRSLEIISVLGKVPRLVGTINYDVSVKYLDLPDNKLKANIHRRLLKRLSLGMLQEASRLHRSGITWKRMHELGLECRYAAHYLQGKISKEEMVQGLENEIWQYAKRQRTWFKKYFPKHK